jgi:hypothetical protein
MTIIRRAEPGQIRTTATGDARPERDLVGTGAAG